MDPADFLAVDDLLSEEERDVRDTVRAFARAELAPHIAEWYDAGTLPAEELTKKFADLGLFGMHLEGYGCAGTSATAYGIACRELEAVDTGLRSFVSVQGSLAMYSLYRWGSEEQKQTWLPRMAAGEAIGCFGLTEPDAGSDPGLDAHPGPPGRRRLGDQRRQDVDHQRHARPRRRGLGADRRGDPGLRGPHRHPRLLRHQDPAQALDARLGHRGAVPRRRPAARPTPSSPTWWGSRVR